MERVKIKWHPNSKDGPWQVWWGVTLMRVFHHRSVAQAYAEELKQLATIQAIKEETG